MELLQQNLFLKLLHYKNDYQDLFNNTADAIYIQDKEWVFLNINLSAVQMYDYPKEYFLGKTPDNYMGLRIDGSLFEIESNGSIIFNKEGLPQ